MLIIIAYVGYHFLRRQEYARTREAALAKAAKSSSSSSSSSSSRSGGSSSSSSSSKPLSSKDVKSGGLPATQAGAVGNPAPKKVSGGSSSSSKEKIDPRKDPSSLAFRKNYFLTMQGPGRPALVPFPDGLRPKKGQAEGTMWWDNIPDGELAF